MEEIPETPLQTSYRELRKSSFAKRLDLAKSHLAGSGRGLADEFKESIADATSFFGNHDFSEQPLYPKARTQRGPLGLKNSVTLGRYLQRHRVKQWAVVGDSSLDFYYLDRELVATRAPGARLEGGRSTRLGPRIDLLLANAETGRPILGEVKLTSSNSPDKDPYYALIQALASAAYLLPRNQISRLALDSHDPEGRITDLGGGVELYLLIGHPPERSRYWHDLQEVTGDLARVLAPRIEASVSRIAGLQLDWNSRAASAERLEIASWLPTYPRSRPRI